MPQGLSLKFSSICFKSFSIVFSSPIISEGAFHSKFIFLYVSIKKLSISEKVGEGKGHATFLSFLTKLKIERKELFIVTLIFLFLLIETS